MKLLLPLCSTVLAMSAMGFTLSAIASPTANSSVLVAQAGRPTTSMTVQSPNAIAVQIREGDFFFHGTLTRSYGNLFSGTDGRVRVNYDRDSGRLVVFNALTGDEFYNYTYRLASGSSSSSSSSSSASRAPVTYMTPQDADSFRVQITEGEFKFRGLLTRSSGSTFIGSDGRVRVIYDKNAGRMVVINAATGTEFYNYRYVYR